ncbi:outer membrane beta-barrel protein [Cesiribacter sp. SM1]|uniref:outer membrane beta-barrel protein n=1 Tax=Cesiribacter sp. SM1 TaxID=2861196 RepID=UPI001CD4E2B7|nr:outer membrane beta-barrel protein [Cesiribacter sp. SM1]
MCGFAQLRIGPLAGASLNRVRFAEAEGSEYYSSNRKPGYHGGIATNYKVNDRYSLHLEWLYVYRQKDVSYNRGMLAVRDQASLNYLTVPILYRVSFHSEFKKSHQEWYLNAGPALHYWMGGRGKLQTNEQASFLENGSMNYQVRFGEVGEYGSSEYVNPANRWQMSLYAGGGVIFDLGFGRHIWLDARTSLGPAKSYFSSAEKGGDFGLQLYKDNLQSSIMSWSLSAGFMQDIDVRAVLKKGKSVNRRPSATKKKSKRVIRRPKGSG